MVVEQQAIDRYAVFGNPIKHSKSPFIHQCFAEQTEQTLVYRAQRVEEGTFPETVTSFFAQGGKGLNVTVPFKLEAFALAERLSDRAQRAGAVNTLAPLPEGGLYGDNTDGVGLVRDLTENLCWEVSDRRVLVLGAGGAVRGVLEPLLRRRPLELVVANRTLSKAEQLAQDFADLGPIRACSFDALAGQSFDLVINGTAASLAGELPPLPEGLLSDQGCCYDMMYGAEPTVFMRWAAENAAWAVSDGLGMLVEQAAEAFWIWRGIRPQTRPVIDQIRASL